MSNQNEEPEVPEAASSPPPRRPSVWERLNFPLSYENAKPGPPETPHGTLFNQKVDLAAVAEIQSTSAWDSVDENRPPTGWEPAPPEERVMQQQLAKMEEGEEEEEEAEEGEIRDWEEDAAVPVAFFRQTESPICEAPSRLEQEKLQSELLKGVSSIEKEGERAVNKRLAGGVVVPPSLPEISPMELEMDLSSPVAEVKMEEGLSCVDQFATGDEGFMPPMSAEIHPMEYLGTSGGGVDEDGPPPGWEATTANIQPASCGIIPMEIAPIKEEELADANDEDGPPPGWEAVATNNDRVFVPPASSDCTLMECKMEITSIKEEKIAYDGVGPPPGWDKTANFMPPPASPKITLVKHEMKEIKANEHQVAPARKEGDEDGPPPDWEGAATKEAGAGEPVVQKVWSKLEKGKMKEEETAPPGSESVAAPWPPLPPKPPSAELGQVICGTCRTLLSYTKGAKYVQCAICQTVSYVLEAHQVGQVYCGGCKVLLMYKYGSQAARCSSCQYVTRITPQNRRPPLSEQGSTLQLQLAQLRVPLNHAQ